MPLGTPALAVVGVGADEHPVALVVEDHLVEKTPSAPQSAQGSSNFCTSKG